MTRKVQNWLLMGSRRNWEKTLSQPVPLWGLRSTYQSAFQYLNIGDILWFYVVSPVKGIIGLGRIKDKYIDGTNLIWDEEIESKKVIWPLRFRIHVLKVIDLARWKRDSITINDLNINWRIGFQPVQEGHLIELMSRAARVFGTIDEIYSYAGPTIAESLIVRDESSPVTYGSQAEETIVNHRHLQEAIAEIGKLQYYHTQIEYPIQLTGEHRNLDVVWKREIAGVPTFVFEVELTGSVERAVSRLKFAFTRWNSRPRIVTPRDYLAKINNITSNEEKTFATQLKTYEPAQILELLTRKRELKAFEQNLEIY